MDPLPNVVCRFEPRNGEFCYAVMVFSRDRTRFNRDVVSWYAMRADPVGMIRHILLKRGVDAAMALRDCWMRENPIPDGWGPRAQELDRQQKETAELIKQWMTTPIVLPGLVSG